jgi:hypothetical protein
MEDAYCNFESAPLLRPKQANWDRVTPCQADTAHAAGPQKCSLCAHTQHGGGTPGEANGRLCPDEVEASVEVNTAGVLTDARIKSKGAQPSSFSVP